jgi:transcriptional regulator with XRE-family HTH domain
MNLGTQIAQLRKATGITQEQLAQKLGVTNQAVSKWELGQSCPDISLLPAMADFFGVTIDRLLRGEPEETVRIVPVEERKDISQMLLRIRVLSHEGDKVKVNLPAPLLQMALEIGMAMPQINGQEAMKNVDLNAVLQLIKNGAVGKLVEVESAEGDIVEITVE